MTKETMYIILCLLYFVINCYCARVRLYDDAGHEGDSIDFQVDYNDKKCHNVPQQWFNKVSSVNTGNICLDIYAELNCTGERTIKLYPGNYGHLGLNSWDFNDEMKSMESCQKVITVANHERDGDSVSFFKKSNTEGEFFNMNVHSCANLVERWRNRASSLVTFTRCYVFYSGLNCTGKALKVTENYEKVEKLSANFEKQINSVDICHANQPYDFIYSEEELVPTSTEKDNLTDSADMKLIILASVVPLCFLLLLTTIGLVIFCIYFRKRTRNINPISMEEIRKEFLGQKYIQLFLKGNPLAFEQISFETADPVYKANNLPYDAETYEISLENIIIDNKYPLGTGEFGIVSKGLVTGPKFLKPLKVAVKTLKADADPAYIKALLEELKIMMYLQGKQANTKHPHIVNLVVQPYIILELCSNGSLDDYLKKERKTFVNLLQEDISVLTDPDPDSPFYENSIQTSTATLLMWSSNIANGMKFLSTNKIIHGDLAARNILLDSSLTVKISDFGLSKKLYNYKQYVKKNQAPMPWRWMAIESLRDFTFSIKSDVWSYGITLWEIFSLAEIPYPGIEYSPEFSTTLKDGLRMASPENAPPEIYQLMLSCWVVDPDERPSYDKIQSLLSLVREKWSLVENRNEVSSSNMNLEQS